MKFHKQYGLSLVELMIAMVIASFLILGVTQIYIDNKRNYLFQQGQMENQENGRFTLQALELQLTKTGFRRSPDEDPTLFSFVAVSAADTGVSNCAFNAGEVARRIDAKTICIRFQPRDPAEVDCNGNLRSANTSAIALPYKASAENFVEKLSVNSSGQLVCTTKGSGGEVAGVLVEGIADFRFDFGVGPVTDRSITSYKETPASGDYIRSVRYSALMTSSATKVNQDTEFKTYKEWYGASATTPTDGRIYQIVKSTVMLRNQMP